MQSFPFDSHVTYQNDGTPVYDRAINSEVYRGLLNNLFTTGILSSKSDNMKVTSNNNMTVNVLPGFAMVEGVMNLSKETVVLDIEAADATRSRIDTVVLRLNTNDDFRNCEFYIVKGTASESPVRPALTREISIYEIGLADITVTAGATSITEANITDTRYEAERCGVIATGDLSAYIHDIQSNIDEINKNLTANDVDKTKFNFAYQDGQYGYYKPGQSFAPFGGDAYLYRYGKKTKIKELTFEPVSEWERLPTDLPYKDFYYGSAVVDSDGHINLLGGYDSGNHYVLVDGVWSEKQALPAGLYQGSAVVDNAGHINIMGGSNMKLHYYVYADGAWSSQKDLPYSFDDGAALLDKNGNINIIGSSESTTSHYKLVDGVWSSVSTLPYDFYGKGATLDDNNDINILGTNRTYGKTNHYKYHDGAWVSVSTLPVDFEYGYVVLDVDTIVILGGRQNDRAHYAFFNGNWQRVDTLPYGFYDGAVVVDNNGEINLLGGHDTNTTQLHYKYHQTGLKLKA